MRFILRIWWVAIFSSLGFSADAAAEEYVPNLSVTQIGTYQASGTHFVWFSQVPSECVASTAVPVMSFNDSQPGGKALLATLMVALTANRKVDVRVDKCNIVEIYLK